MLLPLGSCLTHLSAINVRNAQAAEPAPLSDAALTLGVSQDLSPSALVLKVRCAFSDYMVSQSCSPGRFAYRQMFYAEVSAAMSALDILMRSKHPPLPPHLCAPSRSTCMFWLPLPFHSVFCTGAGHG